MSDRSGAYLFSKVFNLLAEDPARHWKVAAEFWAMAADFDFSYYQMYCDEALLKLGLAREVPDEGACVTKDATHVIYFNDWDGFDDRSEAAPEE